VNEKKRRIQATDRSLITDSPEFVPFKIKTQSQRGPGISPWFQAGIAWIVLWYMPVVVDGFDGAQNMARAE